MSADDLLAGPVDQIDVAHLAAEHRAACEEVHRLRTELRRLQRVVIATRHQEHYRTCGCLGDSSECCDESCECHVEPSPATCPPAPATRTRPGASTDPLWEDIAP